MRVSTSLVFVFILGIFLPATTFASPNSGDETALAGATHALCHRQVVMLGESDTHGDGHTETFKVALVERLINDCGFDSIYFEASHYEFINITRHLREMKAVSTDQFSDAVGGLWRFDKEFQPLVPFLLRRAIAGQISLGGIDDQLGQFGQDYANVTMIANLIMVLPQQESQQCSLALKRRINGEDWEGNQYSKSDRTEIISCLSAIRQVYAQDKTRDRASNEEWLEMVDAVQSWISRDSLSRPEQIVGRDRSMFRNFEWLRRNQPRRHKVILWAATVHISKYADPTWGNRSGTNFGSFIYKKYGTDVFSLGFSALGGRYRQGRDLRDETTAPAESLEAQAMRDHTTDAVFVGPTQLEAMGSVTGAIFRHSYQTLRWSNFLDAVVVFKMEYPPTSTK